MDIPNVLTASLTCKQWLSASQCLNISKRICLKISKRETITVFRNPLAARRFCYVTVEGFENRFECLKLNFLWRKYKNLILGIHFVDVKVFSAITSAIEKLQKVEQVTIVRCSMYIDYVSRRLPKVDVNMNVTGLVFFQTTFYNEFYMNYLLTLLPNLSVIIYCSRSYLGEIKMFESFPKITATVLRILLPEEESDNDN